MQDSRITLLGLTVKTVVVHTVTYSFRWKFTRQDLSRLLSKLVEKAA